MCSPTLVISGFSQALKFQQARKESRIARAQALKQREIAKKNYRLKVAQETLKLRQTAKLEKEKAGAVDIQGRQVRAKARTQAEGFTGGVLDRVLKDYYRQQGNYKASVLQNLDNEIAQSDMNIKGYGVELEANTPYVPRTNPLGLVGASALAWGNDFYSWKAEQEKLDLLKKRKIGGYDYSYYGSSE